MRGSVRDDYHLALSGNLLDRLPDQLTHNVLAGAGCGLVRGKVRIRLRGHRDALSHRFQETTRERATLLGIGNRGRVEIACLSRTGEDLAIHVAVAESIGNQLTRLLTTRRERTRDADHAVGHGTKIVDGQRRIKHRQSTYGRSIFVCSRYCSYCAGNSAAIVFSSFIAL